MATIDRTLLEIFLSGNLAEAHKAAPPLHLQHQEALRQWNDIVTENERARAKWALTLIAADHKRKLMASIIRVGGPSARNQAERRRLEADLLYIEADKELVLAISSGAFDEWHVSFPV